MTTVLIWTGADEDARAASARRVPEKMTTAFYWIQDDAFRLGGPNNHATPWHLSLVGVDARGDEYDGAELGHHATVEAAKATAAKYEQTGKFSPADCLPDLSVVATSDAVFIKTHPTANSAWRSTWGGFHGNWEVDEVLADGGGRVLRVGADQQGSATGR